MTQDPAKSPATFTTQFNEINGLMVVLLNPNFIFEDWNALLAFVRLWIERGVLNWDLDLRHLSMLTSMLIGALIGLNTVLLSHNGCLRLVLGKNSRLAQIVNMSKINRIIIVLEV